MRPTFFVTAVCHQRAPIFRNARYPELMIETLYAYREQQKYLLHEFVLMHDHIHALITPAELLSLERVMQFIKGGFSFRAGKLINRKQEIWQRSFTHESVKGAEAYRGFREYIHRNPVVKRYCLNPMDYAFSSANGKFELDECPEHLRG
jgi:putative transposase